MLLDRRSEDGASVLVLHGPVAETDAPSLHEAVSHALSESPRGVVIDLAGTETVAGGAVEALAAAAARAGCWPRPSVAVCGAPAEVRPRLEELVRVHDDRQDALAHLDDRTAGRAWRQVAVEHGPHGPRQARRAVQQWLCDVGLSSLADDVLLIVSELVTNAVRYGSPPVRVSVSADDRAVTVGVDDAASAPPVPRVPGQDAESGRGLLLLSLLSAEHGVRPDPPGKVVWASLPR